MFNIILYCENKNINKYTEYDIKMLLWLLHKLINNVNYLFSITYYSKNIRKPLVLLKSAFHYKNSKQLLQIVSNKFILKLSSYSTLKVDLRDLRLKSLVTFKIKLQVIEEFLII